MIEINLVPDVKQELIHAQRVRMSVISIATIIGIVSVGLVVLLFVWLGVQAVRTGLVDRSITSNSKRLAAVPDINETLTIQNQLDTISTIHASEHMNSRIFDVLTTVVPQSNGGGDDKRIQYSNVSVDTTTNTVTVQAQTPQYNGLDAFKKTIEATKFEYSSDGSDKTTVPLASNVSIASQSYGQDATGTNVLTFTLSFVYPAELLTPTSKNARLIGPSQTNATDSFQGVPTSLFTQKAETEETN